MFENRSEKQLIVIYALIALIIALIMAVVHYFQGWHPYVIIFVANVWFFCIFLFLYWPLKVKKAREKQKEKK